MPNEIKLSKLIKLLIRKTTEGEIAWTTGSPPRSLTEATDLKIYDYFTTEYKEQEIAIYEFRYQSFDEDRGTFWRSKHCLAFIDDDKVTWETWDESYPLGTLMRVVRESVAEVDSLLDRLLEE